MRREKEDREQRGSVEKREEVEEKRRAEEKKQTDKGKRAPPTMEGKGKDHHQGTGKNSAQGSRGSSVVEDSIRNGETIREEWGTFSERGTRLK